MVLLHLEEGAGAGCEGGVEVQAALGAAVGRLAQRLHRILGQPGGITRVGVVATPRWKYWSA